MKIDRLTLGLLVGLSACGASTQKKGGPRASSMGGAQPDWVSGNSSQFSRGLYMTGVGSGEDRPSSEDRARGEISRVFSSAVDVLTTVSESEEMKGSNGKTASDTFSHAISQNIQTTSKQVLEGVEIVDNWQDKGTSRYYALAALERQKGLSIVSDKIADFDKQAGEWKTQMDQSSEKLNRVKAAMKLLALLKAREALNSQRRVLDPGGQGAPNPLNEAQVRALASKTLSSLDVAVSVAGEGADAVQAGIVKGLASFGLQAKAGAAEQAADITVEAKVDSQPMQGDASAWKWARSSVNAALKEGRTGKIFLQFDASERTSAVDQKEASRRSLVKLSAAVAAKVADAVSNYFENQ